MKQFLLTILLVSLCALGASAQRGVVNKKKAAPSSTLSVGIGGGTRINYIRITNVSPNLQGDPFATWGFLSSLFVSWDFWDCRIGIRPQVSWLRRGGEYNLWAAQLHSSVGYDVRARYIDVRMPIVFNFQSKNSRCPVVPYVFATPILGFASGGDIVLNGGSSISTSTAGIYMEMPITKANIAKHYLGAGAGAGVKYKFEINRQGFLLGLEAMYDHGFNNTYGKQEIDGKSNDVGNLVEYNHDKLKGERCFKGIEMQLYFGMPFDLSIHRREKPQTTRSVRNL